MSPGLDETGMRLLRWSFTVVIAAALLIVVVRVSACLSDDLCTFAPGALQSAVMAFVGGPVLVLAVWLVPALLRHRSVPRWTGYVALGGAAAALVIGFLTLDGGGPAAAVVPSLTPALGLAGLLILTAARVSPAE